VLKGRDQDLLNLANRIIKQNCQNMPTSAVESAYHLINHCDRLMAFIFFHEFNEDGQVYEGATLSLGRKNNKRYRDRLDIIVESSIVDGLRQGSRQLRVFVDPYTGDKAPLWSTTLFPDTASAELFERLSEISSDWLFQKDIRWDHWTSDYIDYFGPLEKCVKHSFFHQHIVHPHKDAVMSTQNGQHVHAE
jgi:hypothetical protein